MACDISTNELIACVFAREVQDGDSLQCGANAIVQRAGILLGHLHHGPNCRILIGRTYANLYQVPVLELYESNTDIRAARWGEYVIPHDESFSFASERQIDLFCISALQIDRYGNTNMIGIGSDIKRLKLRGPGGVGTTPASANVRTLLILMPHHERRVFVEKLDFLSGVGFGDGPGYREKYKLPGKGPTLVATPLGVFDFEPQSKRMRLKSLHPGVTVEQVIENTGFELLIPDSVPTTPAPTEEEITILRNRIDPQGSLRSRK